MKFVSKPVYIEAIRFDGDTTKLDALRIQWTSERGRIVIDGESIVNIGDWIKYSTDGVGMVIADVITNHYLQSTFTPCSSGDDGSRYPYDGSRHF